MWPFKSPDLRLRNTAQEQYDAYLRQHGFAAEPETSERPAPLWGLTYRSGSLRLRITRSRGLSELVVSGAPLHPTGSWYEEEWYLLSNVVQWLYPNTAVADKWTAGPSAAVLTQTHDALVRFVSPEGATQREQFVEFASRPGAGPSRTA